MSARDFWNSRNPQEAEKRILVVHSDETFREQLTATLAREGYNVKRVASASAALESISADRPPLLMLEVNFPDQSAHAGGVAWDNFLVMSWAGRFNATGAIPFIALSSNADAKDQDQALEFGAMGFLTTAAGADEVLCAVNRAFEMGSVA
jgi:CheY-like chemotaxis protein